MEAKYLNIHRREDLKNTKIENKLEGKTDTVMQIDNGVVLPLCNGLGGVRQSNGRFIEESKYQGDWVKLGGDYEPSTVVQSEEKVIYLGFFLKHWGHFLIDAIGRCWILCNKLYDNYKCVYLLEDKAKTIDGNYEEFLGYLGLKKERILSVEQSTQFREVIIPSLCTDAEYGFSQGYKDIFKQVLHNANIDDILVPEKIYMSRTQIKGIEKKEFGEKGIEANFACNNYQIVYPERLTLREQIAMFQKAKEIVCINRTIPFGIVYAAPSLKLVVLNKMSLIHFNLLKLSMVSNVTPLYIDVYREPIKCHPRYLGEGPFWMETGDNLKRYFEDNKLIYTSVKSNTLRNYVMYYYVFLKNRCKSIIKTMLSKFVKYLRK